MELSKYAIIVAGGSGLRMGSKIPKQFLEMKGKPILMHTIEAFHKYSPAVELILVLPEAHIDRWEQQVEKQQFTPQVKVQIGGNTRFQSVKKGLEMIDSSGLVAVHDGVRPIISSKMIQRSFETATKHGSAVAAINLRDSIRRVTTEGSEAVDRNNFMLVQTPQTFDVQKLKQAYQLSEQDSFTDDASVWEAAGNRVYTYEGEHQNIKITTFHDLVLAEVLLKFM